MLYWFKFSLTNESNSVVVFYLVLVFQYNYIILKKNVFFFDIFLLKYARFFFIKIYFKGFRINLESPYSWKLQKADKINFIIFFYCSDYIYILINKFIFVLFVFLLIVFLFFLIFNISLLKNDLFSDLIRVHDSLD